LGGFPSLLLIGKEEKQKFENLILLQITNKIREIKNFYVLVSFHDRIFRKLNVNGDILSKEALLFQECMLVMVELTYGGHPS
jgi:hypothetical protein